MKRYLLVTVAALSLAGCSVPKEWNPFAYEPMAPTPIQFVAEAPRCEEGRSLQEVRDIVKDAGLSLKEFKGSIVEAIIDLIVDVAGSPPDEDYEESDVLFIVTQEHLVMVGFFKDGCYVGRIVLPDYVWQEVYTKARGPNAGTFRRENKV